MSISVTDISNTVHAFIGDANGSGGPVGSVTAGDTVQRAGQRPTATARTSTSWAISVVRVTDAGEVQDKSRAPARPAPARQPRLAARRNNRTTSEFGLGVSGDIGINYVVENIQAYISECR